MAAYLSNLQWMRNLQEFDPEEQKVLLALSHERYRWRTRDRLLEVTGLNQKELDFVLSRLIDKGLIRATFSKKHEVIFGLKERVN
jgi:RIO-like serine/threonine protein kinase